jgi:hypothetical protein
VPDRLSDEARATTRLREAGDALIAGVATQLPGWSVAQVDRILDAWGRAEPDARERARAGARDAGTRAAGRVVGALAALLERDPAAQAATPLEIVRSAYEEPTEVLIEIGVPPVERDDFDERAWPGDRYGLVPRTLSDLRTSADDDELGPLLLVWGMAKAAVLRARAGRAPRPREPPPSQR